jgi:Secretion system C-terminal sorting domain/Lamin Tail Domain
VSLKKTIIMKNYTLLIISFIFFTLKINAQCTNANLIISEYVEGSGDNKCIEVYNGTGAAIDLSTSNYKIRVYYNGNTSYDEISLNGTGVANTIINNNSTFVICHSACTYTGTCQRSSYLSYNGDDAVALVNGATILDVIGQIGTDPGVGWGTSPCRTFNATLVKGVTTAGACIVDTDGSDAYNPSAFTDAGGACLPSDTYSSLGTPLPIELSAFNGKMAENAVNLTWTSEIERDNDYYTIWHSTDAYNFKVIGRMEGAGDSQNRKTYTFTHEEPQSGTNYYRLSQTDFDKQERYVGTLSLKNKAKNLNITSIYPNPTASTLNVRYETTSNEIISYQIRNHVGSIVFTGTLENISKGENSFNQDVSDFPNGIYFLQLKNDNETVVQKFIKN